MGHLYHFVYWVATKTQPMPVKTTWMFVLSGWLLLIFQTTAFAQIDSLLGVSHQNRDTTWVDKVTFSSWDVMYSNPRFAMKALNEAVDVANQKGFTEKLPRLYLNVGIAYDVLDVPDSALLLYNRAKDLTIELGNDAILASAYNNIGLVHWNLNQLDSALYYYIKSEKLFQQVGNIRGLTSTMNNIGLIHMDQNRLEEARKYFRKVLAQSAVLESLYFESVAYQNLGLSFEDPFIAVENTHLDSAIYYTLKAVPIQIEIENDYGLAKSYHSLSSFYQSLEQDDLAIKYGYDAIATNERLENYHAIASNYYQITGIYIKSNDLNEAAKTIKKAAEFIPQFDDPDLVQKILEAQVDVYLKSNNLEIFDAFRASNFLQDSLHDVAFKSEVINMQEAYNAEKREKEIAVKNAEIEVQDARLRTQVIIGIVSIVLIVAFIIWLIARFRYRQRINALEYKNQIHAEKSRISKDLHDNVGAQLTSIATRIAMAGNLSDTETSDQLKQAGSEAKETIDLLRDTIWAMNQESFTVDAFSNRVQNYAAQHLRGIAEVSVNKATGTYDDLNSHQALNLFRIVQEAIQNTIKHSGAREMEFTFKKEGEKTLLRIHDDGIGMQYKVDDNRTHYGLENMRSRAEEMNAEIKIAPKGESGFTILISW